MFWKRGCGRLARLPRLCTRCLRAGGETRSMIETESCCHTAGRVSSGGGNVGLYRWVMERSLSCREVHIYVVHSGPHPPDHRSSHSIPSSPEIDQDGHHFISAALLCYLSFLCSTLQFG